MKIETKHSPNEKSEYQNKTKEWRRIDRKSVNTNERRIESECFKSKSRSIQFMNVFYVNVGYQLINVSHWQHLSMITLKIPLVIEWVFERWFEFCGYFAK